MNTKIHPSLSKYVPRWEDALGEFGCACPRCGETQSIFESVPAGRFSSPVRPFCLALRMLPPPEIGGDRDG